MKKPLFRAIIAATGISLSLLVWACGSYEAESKRYELERLLFEANKRMENFSVKPEMRSTADFAYLVDGYRKVYREFLELFPNLEDKDSLSRAEFEAAFIAGRALSTAASTFIAGEELDSAAGILDEILDVPYFSREHRHQALLLSGHMAKRKGEWLKAEEYYLELLNSYFPPIIRGGMPAREVIELPKAIAAHYVAIGDEAIAAEKVDWAINYYRKILDIEQLSGTPLALTATRSLAEMYNAKGQYQKSVELLSSVTDTTGEIAVGAKLLIADLKFTQLGEQAEAVRLYEEIIAEDTDSTFIPSALMKLAKIAMAVEEWDRSRDYIQQLKKKFRNSREIQIRAQELLAESYEEEGEWDRALQEYQFLLTQYPDSPEALEVLVYLPTYFQTIDQPELEKIWVEKAEEELAQIREEYSGRQLGLMASGQLARLYVNRERYADAINTLRQLRDTYPNSAHAVDALLKIGTIYRNNLNDNEQALQAYKEFVKQYPNSVVTPKVEEEISILEQG